MSDPTKPTNPDTSRLEGALANLPPGEREKALAAIAEIGRVMAAYHPDKVARDGIPDQPITSKPAGTEPEAASPPTVGGGPYRLDWKVAALQHVAMELVRISNALDRAILPAIARKPKSQRQIQRDLDNLRSAWEEAFGKRRACMDVLRDVVEARTPEDVRKRT